MIGKRFIPIIMKSSIYDRKNREIHEFDFRVEIKDPLL
jgi:hypothetical protein